MRIALTFLMLCFASASCSGDKSASGACSDNSGCAAGEICLNKSCVRLCANDTDCGAQEICSDTICVVGTRAGRPEILSLDGTGDVETLVDSRGTATAHHLRDRLIVRGTNLGGVSLRLVPASGSALELAVENPGETEVVARLPDTVGEGLHVLHAANAAGTDQVEVWLLRGEKGEPGDPQTGAGVLSLLQSLGNPVPSLYADRAAHADTILDGSGNNHSYDEMLKALVPAGAVMMFAMSNCPDGWLAADGEAVSRTTYARLFAAIGTTFGAGDGSTTFAKPDLRGEFLRGWDASRGVDSGRTLGSAQGSATRVLMNSWFNTANGMPGGVGDAAYALMGHDPGVQWVGVDYQPAGPSTFTVKRSMSPIMDSTYGNAGESRPRNVALLACVKL